MNINSNEYNDKKEPIKPIVLGKIGSCYGIYGWLRVFSFTEKAKNIFAYQPWFIQKENQWKKIQLESWRCHNKGIILKLRGIDDPNAANTLNNREIIVDSSKLPLLEDDFYYIKDLIGCKVVTIEGYNLGNVISVMETGSNNVLIIKSGLKDVYSIQERLVPFLDKQVIKKIDLNTQIIEVDWDPNF